MRTGRFHTEGTSLRQQVISAVLISLLLLPVESSASGAAAGYPYFADLGSLVDSQESAALVGWITSARFQMKLGHTAEALKDYEEAVAIVQAERVDYVFWGEYSYAACRAGRKRLCDDLREAFEVAIVFVRGKGSCQTHREQAKRNRLIGRLCEEANDGWVFGSKPAGFGAVLLHLQAESRYLRAFGDLKPRSDRKQ